MCVRLLSFFLLRRSFLLTALLVTWVFLPTWRANAQWSTTFTTTGYNVIDGTTMTAWDNNNGSGQGQLNPGQTRTWYVYGTITYTFKWTKGGRQPSTLIINVSSGGGFGVQTEIVNNVEYAGMTIPGWPTEVTADDGFGDPVVYTTDSLGNIVRASSDTPSGGNNVPLTVNSSGVATYTLGNNGSLYAGFSGNTLSPAAVQFWLASGAPNPTTFGSLISVSATPKSWAWN